MAAELIKKLREKLANWKPCGFGANSQKWKNDSKRFIPNFPQTVSPAQK